MVIYPPLFYFVIKKCKKTLEKSCLKPYNVGV